MNCRRFTFILTCWCAPRPNPGERRKLSLALRSRALLPFRRFDANTRVTSGSSSASVVLDLGRHAGINAASRPNEEEVCTASACWKEVTIASPVGGLVPAKTPSAKSLTEAPPR